MTRVYFETEDEDSAETVLRMMQREDAYEGDELTLELDSMLCAYRPGTLFNWFTTYGGRVRNCVRQPLPLPRRPRQSQLQLPPPPRGGKIWSDPFAACA